MTPDAAAAHFDRKIKKLKIHCRVPTQHKGINVK